MQAFHKHFPHFRNQQALRMREEQIRLLEEELDTKQVRNQQDISERDERIQLLEEELGKASVEIELLKVSASIVDLASSAIKALSISCSYATNAKPPTPPLR